MAISDAEANLDYNGPDDAAERRRTFLPPIVLGGLHADQPVATPNGWLCASDVGPGDEVLNGDGCPVQVLEVARRRNVPLCRVVVSDGVDVLCADDQLWRVTSSSR